MLRRNLRLPLVELNMTSSLDAPVDGFPFGRRQVVTYNQTAQPSYSWHPLQPEDFLAAQPGDEFAHGPRHAADVDTLFRALRWHHRYSPLLTVLTGLPVTFPGIKARPAPDLLVVPNLTDAQRPRTQYDVSAEGSLPTFILEVTSPLFARVDLEDKLALYAQASVQEYFILDAHASDDQDPDYRWLAYKLDGAAYRPLPFAADGAVRSAVNRTGFTLSPDRRGFAVVDLRTGRTIIPDPSFDAPPAAVQSEAAARAHALAAQLSRLTRHQKV